MAQAPVGAGGQTGPTTHPGTGPAAPLTPTKPKAKAKVWNDTPQGSHLQGGYAVLHAAATQQLPNLRQQFQHLARRPIGG